VILTSDGKGIDAEKTKRVFGNKLGGIVLGTGPHKTPTFFPGYQPIGRGFNIFGYRGLFYFSTFVVVPSGYADQPGASGEAEDTFGVYLHRRGATRLMCEYTYRETE
jgi:hypothetical protein